MSKLSNGKLRWGVLSTAKIAQEKLIPALQRSDHNEVIAVASRTAESAEAAATRLGLPLAFGSYEEMLTSPDIDAIYNPLPNHLHVPWSVRALESGKHVLCEKPLGLDVADTETLLAAAEQHPHLRVMEAFMYRFHPQWALARQLLSEGRIGEVTSLDAVFSYYNRDPRNVRNMPGIGGGGLLDIGCYCVSASRYLLKREPEKAVAVLDIDRDFEVDRHASGLLDFGDIRSSFYCSTQSEPSQRVFVCGEKGSLLLEYPFYQPDDCAARIVIHHERVPEVIEIDPCDHYQLQVDAFAESVVQQTPVPTPLSDALANMKVLDAVFASHSQGGWATV